MLKYAAIAVNHCAISLRRLWVTTWVGGAEIRRVALALAVVSV
ncbi:MAG: hypothetical protein WCH60_19940 [Burkholderiales bacterium]